MRRRAYEWRSAIHAAQWRTTINDYCEPILDKPVDLIDTVAVLSVLQPIWGRIPETASRLRGRIEAVLDFAKAHKLRSGENPASWRRNLALILPKRQKLSRGHHKAMPYAEVPAFVGKLREVESIPRRAIEFLILTGARSGEVLGARWNEIDPAGKVWSIPASRMKAGREIAFLCQLVPWRSSNGWPESGPAILCFPANGRGGPCPKPRLPSLYQVRRFMDSARPSAIGAARKRASRARAHATGGAVEQAYRRGDALEKRRALMLAWAQFCEPGATGKVVPIRAAK
jgi:integrase